MGDALLSGSEKVIPAIPLVITDGRDEMNLAEWPIALLSSNGKPAASQDAINTLVFRDTVRHPKTGQMVQRTFTVSAVGKWGLPGPAEDEVVLALIQLSKFADFSSRKLYFTRYHLLHTLGWPTNGKYYDRLKEALNRLQGVQLHFERAYWSEEAQSWVDRTFSLYNDLRIIEEENSKSRKPDPRQPTFPAFCCELTWSDFLFDGLEKRTLKHLDFDLYRSLSSAISKRLFRFLDKRLYNERHSSLRMPFATFAVSHIGLADGQPEREYKRRLKPALHELEERGFIKRAPDDERFRFLKRGTYEIFIERDFQGRTSGAGQGSEVSQAKVEVTTDDSPAVTALVQAGMHREQAIKVAKTHTDSEILRKLDILRWRVESGDAPKSPGAWLNDQFRNKYPDPDGYTAHLKAKELGRQKEARKKELLQADSERDNERKAQDLQFRGAFHAWWAELGEEGRSEVDAVIRSADHNDFERGYLEQGETTLSGRAIWASNRQRIFTERTGITSPR